MAKVGTVAMSSAGVVGASSRKDLTDSSHHQFNAKKMKKKLDIFDTAFVGDNGGFQVVVQDDVDDDDILEGEEETASVTTATKDTSKLHGSNESLFMDDSFLDFQNNTQAANNNIKKKKNHHQSDSSPPPPSSRCSSSSNPHAGTLEALLSSDKEKVATRTKSACGDMENNDDKNTLFGRVFMRKKKKNLNELIPRREDLDNDADDRSVGTAPLIPDTAVTPIKKQAPTQTTPVKSPLAPFNPYGNSGRDWTSFDNDDGFFTSDMMTVPDIEGGGEASQRTTTSALSHATSTAGGEEQQQENFESSQRSSSTHKSRRKNNNKNSSFDVGLETPKSPSLSGTGGKKKIKIRRSDLYGPSSRQASGRNLVVVENNDDNDDDSTKRKKKLKKKQGSQRKLKDVEAEVSDATSNKKSLKKKQNSQRKLAAAAAAATESESLLSTDSSNSITMDEEFRSPRRGTRKKLLSQASKQKLQHESDNLLSLSRGGSDHNKNNKGGRPQSRGRSRESTMMPPADLSLELDVVKIDDDEFNFTETSTSIRQGKSLHPSVTAPTTSSSSSASILAPLLPPPPEQAVGRRRSRSACAEKRFSETTSTTTTTEAAQRAASPLLGRHRKVAISASPKPRRALSLMGPPPNDSPVRVASKTAASPKPRRNTQSTLVLSKSQALVLSTGGDLSSPKPVSSRHQSPKFASPKIWKKPPPVRGRSRSPGPGCHQSAQSLSTPKSPKRPLRSRSVGGGLATAESVASSVRARSASPGHRRAQQYQSDSNTATSASPKPGRRRGVRTGPPQKSRSLQLSLSDHNTSPSGGGGTIAGRRRSRSSRHLLLDGNAEPSPKAGGVHHLNQTSHTVMSMPTETPNLSPGRGKQSSSNSCNGTMTNFSQTIVSPKSGRRKAIKSIPRKQRSLREMGAASVHSSSDITTTTTTTPSPGTPTGGRRRARSSRNLLIDNPGSSSPKRNNDKPPMTRFKTLSKASLER